METSLIQAKIDPVVKKNAEAVFSKIGITMSEAIRMFLAQVINDNGLPFQPKAKMDETEYLLSTKANKQALEESIKQANEQKFVEVNLVGL